jgi:hypothetical protein
VPRVRIELVPQGVEAFAREIASATIGNLGGDPLRADYRYRLAAEGSLFAAALAHEGVVAGHVRRQTVWALVWAALDDWWTTDGWQGALPAVPPSLRLRATLNREGRLMEFGHGPWRVVRIGDAEWPLLHGATFRERWSDLDADAARNRLLGAIAEGGGAA